MMEWNPGFGLGFTLGVLVALLIKVTVQLRTGKPKYRKWDLEALRARHESLTEIAAQYEECAESAVESEDVQGFLDLASEHRNEASVVLEHIRRHNGKLAEHNIRVLRG